jgi:acylphosphatase
MIRHLNIFISGEVQGVFYRASAKEKADELGITGFVKNEPDGSVYLEAEGTEEQLNELTAWCRKGPPHSNVTDVRSTSGTIQHFKKFEIRR